MPFFKDYKGYKRSENRKIKQFDGAFLVKIESECVSLASSEWKYKEQKRSGMWDTPTQKNTSPKIENKK